MAIPIAVPRLGWNMEEGVFVGWLKADGAHVRAGEALFTLEGEKATEDVESLDEGVLRISPAGPRPGDTVAVGTLIGHLVRPGEAAPVGPGTPAPIAVERGPVASPRARRVAKELGVDWTTLRGTGQNGRVRERDVRAAATPSSDQTIAVSPTRRTIAERMLTSHQATAPVTLTTTADATNLVNLRGQFKAGRTEGDLVPSYTDFLVKLVAAALQRHPLLNASWAEDRIVLSAAVHVGIAVDADAGLLVPVVRDVPGLSLKQLAARTHDLIGRARRGELSAEEMRGGTFTLTNLGAFGIDAFTPLINPPQCAVLGVGRIARQPAVVGDQVVARDRVTLSLTFDHRVVDGAPAAKFLQAVSASVENPGPWLVG